MKLKATTWVLCAAGMLAALVSIAPALGADAPTGSRTAGGAITSLGPTSITVGDLTCSRGAGSPSLDGYKLGDQVGIGCTNGVLVAVADHRTPATTTTTTTTAAPSAGARDPIGALTTTSITVGPLTCTIGPSSPVVTFKLGDRVRIGCSGGVLVYVVADTDTPPATTTTTSTTTTTAEPVVTRGGTLTAIGEHSLTVDSLTCTVGPSSPGIAAFKLGDHVGVACRSGVLLEIALLGDQPAAAPPAPPSGDHHDELQTRLGTISAVGGGSITVDGLTCSVATGSPSLDGYKAGDQVGIGCANGVLVKIGRPQVSGDDDFKVVVQLGSIVSIRGDGITVGPLSCKLADSSPSIDSYQLGDRVGIGCAGGILFMIGKLPAPGAAPKTEVKQALVDQFHGCIKRGSERCLVAGVLRRLTHKK